jgi:hypothetical protein
MNVRSVWAMLLTAGAAVAVAAMPASAQSAQPWSVQGSLLFASQDVNGKAISGVGFEGQFRYTPASLWSLGIGVQYSSHKSGDETINISGVFLEPRYSFDIGSDRIAPYLAGRLAFLHESSTLAIAGDVSSSGSAFGGGGGFLIRWTKSVNVDIGAAFVSQAFGDASGDGGSTVTFKRFTGYVAKAGLSIGFGSR